MSFTRGVHKISFLQRTVNFINMFINVDVRIRFTNLTIPLRENETDLVCIEISEGTLARDVTVSLSINTDEGIGRKK